MKYLKLMRVKHYIKNTLVFIALFFGGGIFDVERIGKAGVGFVAFSMLSSIIYIINDYRDIEKDRKHPTKKNRPLASGAVSKMEALIIGCVCFAIMSICSVVIASPEAFCYLILYFVLNLSYSMGLKNRPIVDVVILASGFVIRVFYGGIVTDVEISKWLYLVVVTGSLYMGLGKRRNELRLKKETREVLKFYNERFLDKNMYVCVALVNVFYALWSIEMSNSNVIWTVPFFMIILMCYSFDIEGDSDGDPVEVIIHDRFLMGIIAIYAVFLFLLLYLF